MFRNHFGQRIPLISRLTWTTDIKPKARNLNCFSRRPLSQKCTENSLPRNRLGEQVRQIVSLFGFLSRPHFSPRITWPETNDRGEILGKYWTTALPVLLATVVTWNVRPCCLLQWNLIWVKDRCVLSSFTALLNQIRKYTENSFTLKARFKNVAPVGNRWTTWMESIHGR